MTILDGCYSLKLECALRNLGFIDIGPIVCAYAGIYIVRPVAIQWNCSIEDDLVGFQLRRKIKEEVDDRGLHLGWPTAPTAKTALDLALALS